MECTTLVKAFNVLETMAVLGEESGLADIAEAAGLPKPTVHRVLSTLVELGYVDRLSLGVYRLTSRLRMITGDVRDYRLIEAADASLHALHQSTGETVNLGVLRQRQVVYLRVLQSNHPFRRIVHEDACDPYYCTALGRVIAANLPADRQQSLIKGTAFRKRTDHTVADVEELKDRLALARHRGCAIEENETDLGVICIAAPVFEDQSVVAAISISLPSARSQEHGREYLCDAVINAARSASEALTLSDKTESMPHSPQRKAPRTGNSTNIGSKKRRGVA